MVQFISHESLHLRHKRLKVAALPSTHAGKLLKEDIEIMFTLEVNTGIIASGAFENISEAPGDI